MLPTTDAHGCSWMHFSSMSDSGFTNPEVFPDWIKHFTITCLTADLGCSECYITVLSSSTCLLQATGVDWKFFGLLKMVYDAEVDQQIHNQPQLIIPQSVICLPFWNYY
jgi:hypothetical protein